MNASKRGLRVGARKRRLNKQIKHRPSSLVPHARFYRLLPRRLILKSLSGPGRAHPCHHLSSLVTRALENTLCWTQAHESAFPHFTTKSPCPSSSCKPLPPRLTPRSESASSGLPRPRAGPPLPESLIRQETVT